MRVSTLAPTDLFHAPLLEEYLADPEVQLERQLLAATINEQAFARRLRVFGRGRPGWPVGLLLRALVLQRQKGWHDRELESQLRDNARVRVVVGLPLGTRDGPCRSVLVAFRQQLVDAGLELELFGQQAQALAASGLVDPARDEFVVDTTPLEAAAAQPTRVGLLEHGIRRLLLAMRQADAAGTAALVARRHLEGWVGPRFQRFGRGLECRAGRRRWARCYRLARTLLADAAPWRSYPVVARAAAVLERILQERGPDGRRRVPDRLTNALDTDARFGRKGHAPHKITWHGYKSGLLTHVPTDLVVGLDAPAANRPDASVLTPCVDQVASTWAEEPGRLHGDHAFAATGSRREMAARGVVLIGPRVGRRQRGRVPGGGRVAGRADRARRVHIERVHAHLVRHRANRRSWYLGQAKTLLQLALSVVAANLARLRSLIRSGRLRLEAGRLALP
jgi:hypothetical protein